MLPKKGEIVKLTDTFVNQAPVGWVSSCKDVELEVLKVKLTTMVPYPKFDVYVMANSSMNVVNVKKDGTFDGQGSSTVVFEHCYEDEKKEEEKDESKQWAWDPNSKSDEKPQVSEDDRCKKCGTMGCTNGTSCICPNCGEVVWGF